MRGELENLVGRVQRPGPPAVPSHAARMMIMHGMAILCIRDRPAATWAGRGHSAHASRRNRPGPGPGDRRTHPARGHGLPVELESRGAHRVTSDTGGPGVVSPYES
jgi:hypothetical protein